MAAAKFGQIVGEVQILAVESLRETCFANAEHDPKGLVGFHLSSGGSLFSPTLSVLDVATFKPRCSPIVPWRAYDARRQSAAENGLCRRGSHRVMVLLYVSVWLAHQTALPASSGNLVHHLIAVASRNFVRLVIASCRPASAPRTHCSLTAERPQRSSKEGRREKRSSNFVHQRNAPRTLLGKDAGGTTLSYTTRSASSSRRTMRTTSSVRRAAAIEAPLPEWTRTARLVDEGIIGILSPIQAAVKDIKQNKALMGQSLKRIVSARSTRFMLSAMAPRMVAKLGGKVEKVNKDIAKLPGVAAADPRRG